MHNHYYEEATKGGNVILRVNLDETSVAVVPKPLQGVLMKAGKSCHVNAPDSQRNDGTMANAQEPGTSSKVEAPRAEAKTGKSASASSEGPKTDLKASIMGILHADAKAIDSGKTKIDEIASKRKELQNQRKKLIGELRSETRKRQRIRKRSQYLTDEDLVEVLAMRKSKSENNAAEAKSAPSQKRDGAA